MDRRIDANHITRLLDAAGSGRPEALDEVFELAHPRLREIARARRRGWRGAETLNTTGLIHEAYLKLAGSGPGAYESRGHFFATTARVMRQVLINYAEKQTAKKRGGAMRDVTLYESDAVTSEALDELLSLDTALRKLEALDPRQAGVVECLFFAGLSVAETAEALGISPATVKRDWAAARARLLPRHAGRPGFRRLNVARDRPDVALPCVAVAPCRRSASTLDAHVTPATLH